MSITQRIQAILAVCLLAAAPLVVSTAARAAEAPPGAPSEATAGKPATPTPPPPLVVKATEPVDNPYGLDALWKGGDFVARGTLMILVIMSMSSWYVLVTKVFEQAKVFRQAKETRKGFWTAASMPAGMATLKADSAFRYIAQTGVEATARHGVSLTASIDLHTWVTASIQRAAENVQNRLQDGLALLATVGSTAPFIGLFGTVWGIYHALTAIGIAGQASIDKVAGPVGEALIMTAMGLAVAVPAVLGYNWLVRRNKVAMEQVRAFSSDLHSVLISGVKGAAATAGVA